MSASAERHLADASRSEGAPAYGGIFVTAVLVGLGLFGMFYWLLTFDWLAFAGGLIALTSGGILMFLPLTGSDRAA